MDFNFVSIYSSPPYGTVETDSKISTAFFKKLRQMADKTTGKILMPCHELSMWNVGTYRDLFHNEKNGEIVSKI